MAVPVGSDTPLVSSRRSTRARKINPPAVEEVIVKSESEEATTSSQPAMNGQVNPPEAERNDQSTASGDKKNVSEDVEIKEEDEEGPIIEEVNPEEEPMIEEVNPLEEMKEETSDNVEEEIASEEKEMQVEEASQVHVVSLPETPGNESPVFAAIDANREEEEGPVIEEVNPEEDPLLSSRDGNERESAEEEEEARQMAAHVDSVSRQSTQEGKGRFTVQAVDEIEANSNHQSSTFQQANTEPAKQEVIASSDESENVSTEPEPEDDEEEMAGQAEATALSSLSLRRSPQVRKRPVNYALLPEVNESPVFAAIDENREEEEGPVIEEVNPEDDDYLLSPRNGNTSTEAEMQEEASQIAAHVDSVSPVGLRRSTRVRKRPVYYTVQAEEETPQDEPETGTSDTEESDSEESETENEMETDGDPSETEESSPIAAAGSSERISSKPFPCGYCGKTFTSKQHVRRHENNLHRQIQRPRPYACSEPDCGKAFECPSSLEAHTLLHSGLRPFTCGTCGESFRQKGVLKRHQSKHTTERPYACAICKIAFKRKQYLDEHNQRHSGVKPFTCDDCGHSFTSKFLLERHRKLEAASTSRFKPSKSRPFACTVEGCGRGFRTKYILQKHLRAHSGANKVQCPLCGVDFARKFVLKTHCRKIHGI